MQSFLKQNSGIHAKHVATEDLITAHIVLLIITKTLKMSLEISVEQGRRLFAEGPEWFKKDLLDAFGEDELKGKPYESLLTFDDCCRRCGTTEEAFEEKWKDVPVCKQVIALERLAVISKAINGEWSADHFDTGQKKWALYFTVRPSGFAFSDAYYYYDHSVTSVGSRLCTDSREKALFIAEQFAAEYADFFLYTE